MNDKQNNDTILPTEQELAWAARLKQAATADDDSSGIDVKDVSDWEFLQHAIVAKDNTAAALTRLRNLQALKQRYGIIRDGSVDEAARDLKTFLQTHPGLYLSLATWTTSCTSTTSDDNDKNNSLPVGTQIFCSEYQHFNAARMKSEEAYAVYMRAAFYVLQAAQCNLPAVRAGLMLYLDVLGALRYRSFQTEARARALYGQAYPIRIQGVVLLTASLALRMAYQWLFRPWMSTKVKSVLYMPAVARDEYLLNHVSSSSTTPKSCLPQAWGGDLAVDDFYDTILDRLRQRYHLVETFRL